MNSCSQVIFDVGGLGSILLPLALPVGCIGAAVALVLVGRSEKLVWSISDLRFLGRGGKESETRWILRLCSVFAVVLAVVFAGFGIATIRDRYSLTHAHALSVEGRVDHATGAAHGTRGPGAFSIKGVRFTFDSTSSKASYSQDSSDGSIRDGDFLRVTYVPNVNRGNPIVKLQSDCGDGH